MLKRSSVLALGLSVLLAGSALAQGNPSVPPAHPPHAGPTTYPAPGERGSRNMKVLSHIPLGGFLHVSDLEMEQELSRPYVYVNKRFVPTGIDIINIKDPAKAYVMYQWRIENPELHQGSGALGPMYVK